jgi:hypothetical protein
MIGVRKHMHLPFGWRRHSKPFLLLEVRMLNVRLHSIDATQEPIRIRLLSEQNLTPGDAPLLLDEIRNALTVDSLIRDLAIVMNSPAIRHRTVSIPPMSAAEREKVLMLETKHPQDSTEGSGATAFWSAGKTKVDDIAKEHVLCAEFPRSTVDDVIGAVREKNFNLIGFTSHAQMICHLLKECHPDNNLNVAFVEVNEHEGSVTLFHSNTWNMDRHFLIGNPVDFSEQENASGMDVEKLRLEVGRALQYFKQQVRNENIGKIFLYGATREAKAIKTLLESSFRVPVVLVQLTGKKFFISDTEKGETPESRLYDISHIVALNNRFRDYIDFLPSEWRQQKQVKVRQAVVAAAAAAMYIILGGVAYLFQKEAKEVDRNRAGVETPLIRPEAPANFHQLEANRSFAYAVEQSREWFRNRHRVIAAMIRDLANAMPSEMRISGLEVGEKGNAWQVKLQAEIRTSNGSHSQKVFLKFQDQMRRSAHLQQLTWGGIQLTDSDSPLGLDTSVSATQNVLTFTMQGVLSAPSAASSSQLEAAPSKPGDPL